MRRMLDPTKVGGIPSTIEFDKDGNRKVNKNLGVDGKLTLKSLVSGTNPDGDITKELGGGGGGGKLYRHNITFLKTNISVYFDVYSTIPNNFTFPQLYDSIKTFVTCTGIIKVGDIKGYPVQIRHKNTAEFQINYVDFNGESNVTTTNEGSVSLIDNVTPLE